LPVQDLMDKLRDKARAMLDDAAGPLLDALGGGDSLSAVELAALVRDGQPERGNV
ncbi:MAG: hypothetical protein HUJ24_13130, partial [Rhodobacteraceae bacterium]|nr:hypothetical protein [Paracoccaceae bacterium]